MDEEHLGLFFDEAGLRTVLDKAAIRGTMRFEDAAFVLTSDGLGQGRIAVGGPVRVRDVGVLLGLPIVIDQGELQIHSLVFEAGQVRGWIDVEEVRGSIADRAIRDTRLMLTYVNGRLSIDQLDAQFDFGGEYDGRLTSLGAEAGGGRALAIDLGEPYEFELNLELQKVKLDGLMCGLFDTGFSEPGRVDATLILRGRPGHLNEVTGSGQLRLYEARLWSIPVARELFSRLGFDAAATFQEMRTRFDVEDGEVRLSGMLAKSPLARLAGRGTLNLDGTLHVDLEVRYSLLDNLGPLNQLLYRIQNSLLRVAIRGDLARPFVILRNGFVEMFRGFEDHPRALPLPAFQPLPERF